MPTKYSRNMLHEINIAHFTLHIAQLSKKDLLLQKYFIITNFKKLQSRTKNLEQNREIQ